MIDYTKTEALAKIMRAVNNPTRRRIIELLLEAPKTQIQLIMKMRLEQTEMSRHIKILLDSKWIHFEKWKNYRVYSLNENFITKVNTML